MIDVLLTYIPNILGAILILIIGKFVGSIIGSALRTFFKTVKADQHIAKLNLEETTGFNVNLPSLLVRVVKFIVSWGFFTAAVQMLDIEVLSRGLEAIIAYLPNIFAAVMLISLAYVGAKFVKNIILEFARAGNIGIGGNLATAAQFLIMMFGITMGVDQLGIDTSFFTQNFTILLIGMLAMLTVGMAVGGKSFSEKVFAKLEQIFF